MPVNLALNHHHGGKSPCSTGKRQLCGHGCAMQAGVIPESAPGSVSHPWVLHFQRHVLCSFQISQDLLITAWLGAHRGISSLGCDGLLVAHLAGGETGGNMDPLRGHFFNMTLQLQWSFLLHIHIWYVVFICVTLCMSKQSECISGDSVCAEDFNFIFFRTEMQLTLPVLHCKRTPGFPWVGSHQC